MPQRRFQKHGYIATQRICCNKRPNLFGRNLRLPTNHDAFEDGNHQKQVTIGIQNYLSQKSNKFCGHE